MNTIQGRIIVKQTGIGIPDLLVVLYDLDPGTRSEEQPEVILRSAVVVPEGDRLGSVLTDQDGRFLLSYENSEFQIRNDTEARPDLLIHVQAPDEPGLPGESRLLYVSQVVRGNAGRTENYIIRLSSELLTKYEIPLPSQNPLQQETANNISVRMKDTETWQAEVITGTIKANQERVARQKALFDDFHTQVKPVLRESLSSVSTVHHDPDRFVARGESVFHKSTSLIKKGLREVVSSTDPTKRAPRRGLVTLTDSEKAELEATVSADGTIPAEKLASIQMRSGRNASDTFVEQKNAISFCREQTLKEKACLADISGEPTTPPNEEPPQPGSSVLSIDETDIPRYLARLMESMTSPEEQLLVGLMPTASQRSVDASVQSLAFQPSPADVPAFHDFTQLQIAFEHVWQEAIDEGLLDVAEDAYQTIVQLGGKPIVADPVLGQDPWQAISLEGKSTLRASRTVRDHRNGQGGAGGVTVTDTPGGGRRPANRPPTRPPPRGSGRPTVRDHRDGHSDGDDISEYLPEERLPGLLVELEKRLKESYAFTTFAANRKERSVNFGVLNTFRQVWKPLSYQAGPLVKSIPLAPRQSQKLVITRKWHRKRTVKEVENNLRSVREENNQTSRVEQEIARRASSKTTFSLSATASYGAASATTNFSQDAAKSSDDIKKSFHEAVFKSTQEIKQERTTEVNAEESSDFESQETTEISNPNDEIAVTFLFYELQRRYRISERLHRVQPVVLVAQEIPQPHEIDADWLVAHDWILKRVMLDDSFLPILTTLCESSGDESAIAEMRVSVAQQRKIVNEVRETVSIAQKKATLQSALLERAVFTKAGEKGGFLDFVGDVLEISPTLDKVGDLLFGDEPANNTNNRQGLEENAQRAADEVRDLMYRLEREVTALNALMETYSKALREHHTRLTEMARLQVHVKNNILYYMQAILEHEPKDQQYFRLHTTLIPTFETANRKFKIHFNQAMNPLAPTLAGRAHERLARFGGRVSKPYQFEVNADVSDELVYKPLSEVADLDNCLGYKGNYMIFPLKKSNALTDFMMDPFVDRATGDLVDPSDPLGFSLEEFSDYVCCLKRKLTEDEFAEIREDLKAQYDSLLSSPERSDDVLVVPTDSLFIEALPAANSLLERFKMIHRMEDAKLAQAKARGAELENVRKALRLLSGELGDPEIDQNVLIEGSPGGIVVPTPPVPPTPPGPGPTPP